MALARLRQDAIFAHRTLQYQRHQVGPWLPERWLLRGMPMVRPYKVHPGHDERKVRQVCEDEFRDGETRRNSDAQRRQHRRAGCGWEAGEDDPECRHSGSTSQSASYGTSVPRRKVLPCIVLSAFGSTEAPSMCRTLGREPTAVVATRTAVRHAGTSSPQFGVLRPELVLAAKADTIHLHTR